MSINNAPAVKFEYQKSLKTSGHPQFDKILKLNKYIYRPLASFIARLVFPTKITPNQITIFSFMWGIAAGLCFLFGKYNWLVIGAICVQFSQILDCADGMLARTKNMCSDYGSFLDLTVDRVVDFFFLTGISIGLYYSSSNMRLLLIGLFTTGLYFLQVSLSYIFIRFFGKSQPGETEEPRALFILLISIFAILNRLDIFIYLIFIETTINVLLRLGNLIRLRYKNQP